MSDAAITAAVETFLTSLTPKSHRTAGIAPARIDMSLTPDEIRAAAHRLLDSYDAARLAWTTEKADTMAHLAQVIVEASALTGQVVSLTAEVARLTKLIPSTGPAQAVPIQGT